MSEEEIIGNINWAIHVNKMTKSINGDNTHISVNVLQGLLDLYNKEKEKNKKLQEQILNRFERICPNCNNKFIAKKKNTVYCKRCSHLVASLAWQRRNREKVRQYNRQRYKKIKNIKEE